MSDAIRAELCSYRFLQDTHKAQPIEALRPWFGGNGQVDVVDRALMADTANYLPDDLLVKMDIASMAVSLEARSPFLDHHLMEFAASLPARLKLKGITTKYVLKRGLRGLLPEQNLTRAKMGFGVPISHWFRSSMRQFLRETLHSERALSRGLFNGDAVRHLVDEHVDRKINHDQRLWSLLMLELWFQR